MAVKYDIEFRTRGNGSWLSNGNFRSGGTRIKLRAESVLEDLQNNPDLKEYEYRIKEIPDGK